MSKSFSEKLKLVYNILHKTYGPQRWWPADTALEMMAGAILTQNTAWANAEKAIGRLKQKKLLSYAALLKAKPSVIRECIRPAGYFNVKAQRLKNLVAFLEAECGGRLDRLFRIPVRELREKLLSVNGVGPETADSILLYAAGKPFFVVDAYTKRIFVRLGLLKPSAGYDEIQDFFMRRLAADARIFNEYHALIVEHAKSHCANKPRCGGCPLKAMCAHGRRLFCKEFS